MALSSPPDDEDDDARACIPHIAKYKHLKQTTFISLSLSEVMKYLGIIIDDRLRFKDHYDYILKKIGKKISFLNRIDKSITMYATYVSYV